MRVQFVLCVVQLMISGKCGEITPKNGESNVANLQMLKLVHVIFRHGERNPLQAYPKDPYASLEYWPEGWGMLTQEGQLMQRNLGKYIRQRYSGFLSDIYTQEEMYVQSSYLDRAISSAKANIAGIWPEDLKDKNGTPFQDIIPVHVIPSKLDNKILFTKSCPKYWKLLQEAKDSPSEKQFNLEHAKLYQYLSEHTGKNIIGSYDVVGIYDTLFIQERRNLTLPQWTNTVYPDKLQKIAEMGMSTLVRTKKLERLLAGPLLTELVRNIQRAAGDLSAEELDTLRTPPPSKLYMYSGHDITLIPLLSTFGVYTREIPPYASSLYFELHAWGKPMEYFVKIFYRPDIHTPAKQLKIQGCPGSPCTLKDFLNILGDYIDEGWDKECSPN